MITNLVLLGMLLKESNDADNLPEEQKHLYLHLFKDVGDMRMVDVLHLMMIANRKEFKAGEFIVQKGKKREHLYLVLRGRCKVVGRKNNVLGEIGPNQFISEQSFVTWQSRVGDKQLREIKEQEKSWDHMYRSFKSSVELDEFLVHFKQGAGEVETAFPPKVAVVEESPTTGASSWRSLLSTEGSATAAVQPPPLVDESWLVGKSDVGHSRVLVAFSNVARYDCEASVHRHRVRATYFQRLEPQDDGQRLEGEPTQLPTDARRSAHGRPSHGTQTSQLGEISFGE